MEYAQLLCRHFSLVTKGSRSCLDHIGTDICALVDRKNDCTTYQIIYIGQSVKQSLHVFFFFLQDWPAQLTHFRFVLPAVGQSWGLVFIFLFFFLSF